MMSCAQVMMYQPYAPYIPYDRLAAAAVASTSSASSTSSSAPSPSTAGGPQGTDEEDSKAFPVDGVDEEFSGLTPGQWFHNRRFECLLCSRPQGVKYGRVTPYSPRLPPPKEEEEEEEEDEEEEEEDRRGGQQGGKCGGGAQYMSANCVVFTHYSGDVSSVVDEHFSRALSLAAASAPASPQQPAPGSSPSGSEHLHDGRAEKGSTSPMSARSFPPSFWNSHYQPPPPHPHPHHLLPPSHTRYSSAGPSTSAAGSSVVPASLDLYHPAHHHHHPTAGGPSTSPSNPLVDPSYLACLQAQPSTSAGPPQPPHHPPPPPDPWHYAAASYYHHHHTGVGLGMTAAGYHHLHPQAAHGGTSGPSSGGSPGASVGAGGAGPMAGASGGGRFGPHHPHHPHAHHAHHQYGSFLLQAAAAAQAAAGGGSGAAGMVGGSGSTGNHGHADLSATMPESNFAYGNMGGIESSMQEAGKELYWF